MPLHARAMRALTFHRTTCQCLYRATSPLPVSHGIEFAATGRRPYEPMRVLRQHDIITQHQQARQLPRDHTRRLQRRYHTAIAYFAGRGRMPCRHHYPARLMHLAFAISRAGQEEPQRAADERANISIQYMPGFEATPRARCRRQVNRHQLSCHDDRSVIVFSDVSGNDARSHTTYSRLFHSLPHRTSRTTKSSPLSRPLVEYHA